MIGYKLFRKRRDGSLGPLFINARQRIDIGKVYPAESHPTRGYAYRPGWHICAEPVAPHLSIKDRVWAQVEFDLVETVRRPKHQGGIWYLGDNMRVIKILVEGEY